MCIKCEDILFKDMKKGYSYFEEGNGENDNYVS